MTLQIVDSSGKPVERAHISVAFWASDSSADALVSEGQTDTNGCYVAAGKTIHSMNYVIKKDGSYTTTGQYWFYPGAGRTVLDGRWQPWNPTNTVVLKEERNPTAMYAKSVDVPIPAQDVPIPFDFEVGDWVIPRGKGVRADVLFEYHSDIKDFWTGKKELAIACTNRVDGFLIAQKDMWSDFKSAYEAPGDEYQPTVHLILDATKDKILKSEQIQESQYLTFRVRSKLDDKGTLISANYGKIYGPIDYGAGEKLDRLRFTCYFNPTANDRNIEFDPSRNLLDVKQRVYQP